MDVIFECRGNGLPTVIFISGRTDRANILDTIADRSPDNYIVFSGSIEGYNNYLKKTLAKMKLNKENLA